MNKPLTRAQLAILWVLRRLKDLEVAGLIDPVNKTVTYHADNIPDDVELTQPEIASVLRFLFPDTTPENERLLLRALVDWTK